jgi:hypothetical protein
MNAKKVLKKLLREREKYYAIKWFDMEYLKITESEALTCDLPQMQKRFEELEANLREIQGRFQMQAKMVNGWKISEERKKEQLVEIEEKKKKEQAPLVEEIRLLNKKIEIATQIKELMHNLTVDMIQLRKYISLLRYYLAAGLVKMPEIENKAWYDEKIPEDYYGKVTLPMTKTL